MKSESNVLNAYVLSSSSSLSPSKDGPSSVAEVLFRDAEHRHSVGKARQYGQTKSCCRTAKPSTLTLLLLVLLELISLFILLLLFQGGGGGRRLRLGVGKLSSGLTVARVAEFSLSAIGTGGGGVVGEESDRAGRTVATDEANEVEVEAKETPPLLLLVPGDAPTAERRFLFSLAFGVEASEVTLFMEVETALVPGRIAPGRVRDDTRLVAPGGTGGLCIRNGGICGELGRTA